MKTVIIDNYDSFSYNLAHMLRHLGADVDVLRNDAFNVDSLNIYDHIVLSPGPGIPDEAGLTLKVIECWAHKKPILGVCLGHQAIGQYFGAKLSNLPNVSHGIQSQIWVKNSDPIFRNIDSFQAVGRYHSWVVDREGFPDCLEIIAESAEGHIMALRHHTLNIYGLQFHPESVLPTNGEQMIINWLKI